MKTIKVKCRMKKFISVILIPILLIQFFGCYSSKQISIEELSNFEEATITTNNSAIFHLKRNVLNNDFYKNPDTYFYDDWIINPDSRLISLSSKIAHKERIQNATEWTVIKDTTNINYEDIKNISIEELDSGNTTLVVLASIAVVLVIVGYIIAASNPFSLGHN
jgi:hypothetical protein